MTKGREQLEEARRTYEVLNTELHDELPALYDSRILFLVTNLQTLFASEQVFHNETQKVQWILWMRSDWVRLTIKLAVSFYFKVYAELEAIVDKLATDSQRGSYTIKKITGMRFTHRSHIWYTGNFRFIRTVFFHFTIIWCKLPFQLHYSPFRTTNKFRNIFHNSEQLKKTNKTKNQKFSRIFVRLASGNSTASSPPQSPIKSNNATVNNLYPDTNTLTNGGGSSNGNSRMYCWYSVTFYHHHITLTLCANRLHSNSKQINRKIYLN